MSSDAEKAYSSHRHGAAVAKAPQVPARTRAAKPRGMDAGADAGAAAASAASPSPSASGTTSATARPAKEEHQRKEDVEPARQAEEADDDRAGVDGQHPEHGFDVVLTLSPRYRGGSPGTVAFVVIVNMGSSYWAPGEPERERDAHAVRDGATALPQRSQTSVFEVCTRTARRARRREQSGAFVGHRRWLSARRCAVRTAHIKERTPARATLLSHDFTL